VEVTTEEASVVDPVVEDPVAVEVVDLVVVELEDEYVNKVIFDQDR
jgi:hypothetical protein